MTIRSTALFLGYNQARAGMLSDHPPRPTVKMTFDLPENHAPAEPFNAPCSEGARLMPGPVVR